MNMQVNLNLLDRKYVDSVAVFAEKSGDTILGYRVGINLSTNIKGDKNESMCHFALFRTFDEAMQLKVKILSNPSINLDYWFWHKNEMSKWYFMHCTPKVRLNSKYIK